MKKLYLFCSLLLVGFISHAQIAKGTILLGGDLSVLSSSDKVTVTGFPNSKISNTDLSIEPSIGLAIKDNLVLGLNLGVGYGFSSDNVSNTKENIYDFGVFLRKYKYLGSRFYFFGQTSLGLSYVWSTNDDTLYTPSHQNSKSYSAAVGFSPGVAYSLSQRWQLEVEFPNVLSAQYNYNQANYISATQGTPSTTTEESDVTSGFRFNTSLTTAFQLQVGMRYLIGG